MRYNDLPFSQERMKIRNGEERLARLHDEKENIVHIINLKQGLNYGLVFKKVHRVI